MKVSVKNRITTTLPGALGQMPSLPALGFFILVVSIPSQQAGSPADGGAAGRAACRPADESAAAGADGAAAQRPLLGGGHAGTAAHQECCNHDHDSYPSHYFVDPG